MPASPSAEPPSAIAEASSPRRRLTRRRVLAALVIAPLAVLVALTGVAYAVTDVPPVNADTQAEVSLIEWSDGTELARVGAQNRIDVPLSKVSEDAREAVLAAEDRGYYSQAGISPRGILRAALANLRGGGVEQGASTITQQYAKNAYLTRDRTLRRKLQEVVIAVKLDRRYSKDQVLESYLNTVYFGRGAYGIEVAAQTWFAKPASELTASEGAVLAALLRSPTGYDPARDPEAAQQRWRYVLDGMAAQGWLEGDPAAQRYPEVQPERARSADLAGPNGYLVRHVQDELGELGISQEQLDTGGLRVRTTFDRRVQGEAVEAVRAVSGEKAPAGLHRALVAVEPGTGRVRAEYAGDDYVSRPFNDVTQGIAQAGSSFKPYVLAAALQSGMSLRDRFDGRSPQRFGDYEVRNFGDGDGQQHGQVDLVDATVDSVNTVYVPLGQRAGLPRVVDVAASLGVTADMTREREVPSLSLGVTAVHPIDQAVAFATLAARGKRATPFVVEQVDDADGRTLHRARPVVEQVLDTAVADDTSYALQQAVERGTGTAARLDGRPAAGKTGTTTGNTAAWFVGYTPQLATAVALFSDDQETPLRDVAGVEEVTGGSLPAATWNRFTSAALEGQPVLPFAPPQYGGTPTTSPSPVAPSPAPAAPEAVPPPVVTPPRTEPEPPSEPGGKDKGGGKGKGKG